MSTSTNVTPERNWRQLLVIEEVTETDACISVPGFGPEKTSRMQLCELPSNIRPLVVNGMRRFFVQFNFKRADAGGPAAGVVSWETPES